MPIVSRSGRLIPKLFVILYEPSGISDKDEEKMFKPENLIVKWNSSGKMTKVTFTSFLKEAFLPY